MHQIIPFIDWNYRRITSIERKIRITTKLLACVILRSDPGMPFRTIQEFFTALKSKKSIPAPTLGTLSLCNATPTTSTSTSKSRVSGIRQWFQKDRQNKEHQNNNCNRPPLGVEGLTPDVRRIEDLNIGTCHELWQDSQDFIMTFPIVTDTIASTSSPSPSSPSVLPIIQEIICPISIPIHIDTNIRNECYHDWPIPSPLPHESQVP